MDKMILREFDIIEKMMDKRNLGHNKRKYIYSKFYVFMCQLIKKLKLRMNESKKYKFRKNNPQFIMEYNNDRQI